MGVVKRVKLMRWAVPTALGLDAESEDFQAPMRAAGWHLPHRLGGAVWEGSAPNQVSEVLGPGWTQAASTDHSKPTTDRRVRQLQGFDQVLHRGEVEGIAR